MLSFFDWYTDRPRLYFPFFSLPCEFLKLGDRVITFLCWLGFQVYELKQLAAKVTEFKDVARDDGKPDFAKLHSHVLRVRLQHVRARNCWHLLRLWHRTRTASFTSEMLAESCASVVRFVERKHSVGHSLSLQSLCDSAMLRLHGIRGSMEELPFIRSALQEHFQKDIPHFFVQAAYRKRRDLSPWVLPALCSASVCHGQNKFVLFNC